MHARDKDVAEQIQVCISKGHPPLLIDEHAESVAARLDGGDLTDEIAAQLRTLVRHRTELCPVVREFLITKLHFTARRNMDLADQFTAFAAQLAADSLQRLTLQHDDRAAADQSPHRSTARNAARVPAEAIATTRIAVNADHTNT
jgi:hypothetical protein